MNIIKLVWFLPVVFMMTTSCSTPFQPYNHSDIYNEYVGGYSDERMDQNTAIVRFDGDRYTDQQKVRNYLMYRCAQVTLDNGFQYFVIVSTSMSPVVDDVKTRVSYHNYNVYPPRDYTNYYRTVDYVSSHYHYTSGQRNRGPATHSAVAVIKMFTGSTPPVQNAFSADDVIAHIGPQTN